MLLCSIMTCKLDMECAVVLGMIVTYIGMAAVRVRMIIVF
jgi:hypothetical protein